jgi:hypothetical protein
MIGAAEVESSKVLDLLLDLKKEQAVEIQRLDSGSFLVVARDEETSRIIWKYQKQ